MEKLYYISIFSIVAVSLSLFFLYRYKQNKQSDFRELLKLRKQSKFKIKNHYIDIHNSLSTLSKFKEYQETLQDFFSRKIYFIERKERTFRNDIIRLYTRDYPVKKNYKIRSKENGLFGGINYSGKENIEPIDKVSSILFMGQSGSGKSYSMSMVYEAWKQNNNSVLLAVDTKTNFFKDKADHFTSLQNIEDYKKLIDYLKHIKREADKANLKNQKLNCSYFFIFDECIDYLSKSPSDSKELISIKLELADLVTHFIRKISRSQNCPVIFGSQSFSFNTLLINPSFISKIFVSRLKNSQQCNTFGIPVNIGLSESIKNGRWIDTTTHEVYQYPVSLKVRGKLWK